jgi:integrase/recombinase XerD
MRPPDQLSDEEVQRYLLSLRAERPLSSSSCNQIRCALKFFYAVTVRRPQPSLTVPPMRQAQKLPDILSREEVERIVAATRTLRERVLLMATYGGGLQVSEVVALRPTDLDAERGVIRIEQGKGKKDRYTVLAERLVREVGQYYSVYGHPEHWVFPQRAAATRHMDASSTQKIYTTAKRRAGIEKVGAAPRSSVSTATAPRRAALSCGHGAGLTFCASHIAAPLSPAISPLLCARPRWRSAHRAHPTHPFHLLTQPQPA